MVLKITDPFGSLASVWELEYSILMLFQLKKKPDYDITRHANKI